MPLSVIMPTCGRTSLSAAIASVFPQLHPDDELIVVGDGDQPHAEWMCRLARGNTDGRIVYAAARLDNSRFGNAQRDVGISLATGTHLCFLDDDDVYEPGALDRMRAAIAKAPHAVHVFRARWGAGHPAAGTVLWAKQQWAQGNVGTPMVVLPRQRRMPRWMEFNARGVVSDFGWLTAALGAKQLHWHDYLVCTVRPEAHA